MQLITVIHAIVRDEGWQQQRWHIDRLDQDRCVERFTNAWWPVFHASRVVIRCPASLHLINRSILRNSGSYHEQHIKTNCNWRDASSEHFVSHLLLFIMRLTDTLRNFSRKNEKLYFKKSTSFQNSFFYKVRIKIIIRIIFIIIKSQREIFF